MRSSLATRVTLLILAVCGAVLLLAGVGMLGYTFHRERDAIFRVQADVREAHLPSLLAAVRDLSETRTRDELQAILALRHVAWAELEQPEGRLALGDSLKGGYHRLELPLKHPLGGEIGTLRVGFSRQSVWRAVRREAWILLAYLTVLLGVTATSVVVALRLTITRHLVALTRYTGGLDLHSLDRDFAFRRTAPPGGDELENLLQSIHAMRRNLLGQIAARLEAEESLRRTQANYQEVFKATGDALFIHEPDGRVVDLNETAQRMYGHSREEILRLGAEGLSAGEPGHVRAEVARHVRHALETGSDLFQWQARRANGATFWVEVGLTAATLHGRPHVIASVRDIHQRKEMEEQLHHARRLDAIGQLAGGVAHDFNNMLAGMMGAAELLQQLPVGQEEQVRELTGMILQAGGRAADLTRKLLAFSRKGKVESTVIDAHDSVEGALAILAHTLDKKVRLRKDLAAPRSRVVGDPSALQNAILNLCINAGHAMPGGGDLTLTSRLRSLDNEDCQRSRFELVPGPYLELEVRDTGCGIAPENLERIFDPFFTTKAQGEGTGLGLAAVYGTLVSHHGAVEVESRVGEGTVFRLLLPLSDEDATPRPQLSTTVTGTGKVLVVDDEDLIRRTAGLLLQRMGYNVLQAANGKEALEVLDREGGRVDVVLLDMVMPEMDGRECFRRIRQAWPGMPVLLSSGFTRQVDVEALLQEGLAGFLHKPWRADELSAAVARYCRRQSPC